MLTGPIAAASDLAESVSKADVVFGDSAAAIQSWAKTAAQSFGQSRAEALAAAGGFGNLFVSMGLGQKPAADLSRRIVELGSDLASFNNIRPEEALEKLRAGLVGEAEPLRALGVNINAAAVEDEALRLGLAKTKDEITDAAKIQARYSLILKQTKTAQGDFARTSTGLANSQRIIAASFADLQTQIGERLLPVVAPLVSSFAQALPQAMDRLAPILDAVGRELEVWAYAFGEGGIGGVIEQAIDDITSGRLFGALRSVAERAVSALVQGLQAARDVAGRIAGWLAEQVRNIDWRAVWSAVTGVAAGLLAGLGSVVSSVTSWLVAQWRAIDWAAVWGAVTNIASGLVGALGSVASAVTTWLGAQWAAIDWGAVWKSVTGVVTGLLTGLGAIARAVTAWVSAQWAAIDWTAVWKDVQGHGAALVKTLAPITKDVEAWLTAQFQAVDWPAVWAAAEVGAKMPFALIAEINRADTKPVGNAIGAFLVDAVQEAIRRAFPAAAGAGGAFDGLSVLAAVAFVREMANFPFLVVAAVRDLGIRLLKDIFEGAVERLNLEQFKTDLKKKLVDAVTGIFPIKAGPLTIGLGGVSLEPVTVRTPFDSPAAAVKPGPGGPQYIPPGARGPQVGFQHGGSFYVGGRGGADSALVAFRATPGERVTVQTPAQQASAGTINVVLNVGEVRDRSDAEHILALLPDAFSRALEKARSQQGLPQIDGLFRFA